MDAEQLALLRTGVSEWNEWRKGVDIRPDLRGADLRGASLQYADLDDADFTEGDLRGADLRGANLANTCFRRAHLTGVRLADADLMEGDLHSAQLRRADLRSANLSLSHFVEADLVQADLRGARLRSANLSWAHMRQADLTGADLLRAVAVGTDLRGAQLDGAEFAHAGLMEANLEGAKMEGTQMEHVDLRGANLYHVDLRSVNLRSSNLRGARLDMARFLHADLRGAVLAGCMARGALVWDCVQDESTEQEDVIVTGEESPAVAVDDLETTQLLLHLLQPGIQQRLDRVEIRAGLLIGNYGHARRFALENSRKALRACGLLPVSVDCDEPMSDEAATRVVTLAGMVRVVVIDLSQAAHLLAVVDRLPEVPVQPLSSGENTPEVAAGESVLDTLRYEEPEELTSRLAAAVQRFADPQR